MCMVLFNITRFVKSSHLHIFVLHSNMFIRIVYNIFNEKVQTRAKPIAINKIQQCIAYITASRARFAGFLFNFVILLHINYNYNSFSYIRAHKNRDAYAVFTKMDIVFVIIVIFFFNLYKQRYVPHALIKILMLVICTCIWVSICFPWFLYVLHVFYVIFLNNELMQNCYISCINKMFLQSISGFTFTRSIVFLYNRKS